MKKFPSARQLFAIAILALSTLPIFAQTLTSTAVMPVKIEIITACEVSVADLSFGNYTSNSTTAVLGETSISLNCGTITTVEIALDGGKGLGGNTSRRKLKQDRGLDEMDYDLYQDAGRTIHWGDRSGSDTKEILTSGSQDSIPIYGEIPAGQRVRDGTYSDMITVSVLY